MAWQNVLGHDRLVDQFRRALARHRLASTFLFVGPEGIGKRLFAQKLAQSLLCDTRPPEALDPCNHCAACAQVLAGTHPDVEIVAKPDDKAFIPLELLIGDDEHRNRAGLCYNIALKPFSGKRRVSVIDDADFLNREGANCLLKTLEEPPPNALLILLGTSEQRQLPTIRSRCQVIRFQPLATDDVATILLNQGLVDSPDAAQQAAQLSDGSVQQALAAVDPELAEFASDFVEQLSKRELEGPSLAKATATFVDAAGKESAAKRARLRQVVTLASRFYREVMLQDVEAQLATGDRRIVAAASQARRWWSGGDEAAAHCLDACLDAQAAIAANANQATLLECWFDELASIARTGSR
jgi:DNA polymerase-3 subunit delta'